MAKAQVTRQIKLTTEDIQDLIRKHVIEEHGFEEGRDAGIIWIELEYKEFSFQRPGSGAAGFSTRIKGAKVEQKINEADQ